MVSTKARSHTSAEEVVSESVYFGASTYAHRLLPVTVPNATTVALANTAMITVVVRVVK